MSMAPADMRCVSVVAMETERARMKMKSAGYAIRLHMSGRLLSVCS